ncbi:VCBS repeat-containing protein [Frankia sp. AgB32]|uniref:FG-GAP repeat domain-containing protein n=1 Tax=Frankia sp. AgB32 TaxID=631119 RepID=UPI00200E903C|nr:VCBS repeat-containing protein [Frankia sp. AgB32]MCK9897497.1 VCBS repeat-containing protein [Frankia sp. AgB32]
MPFLLLLSRRLAPTFVVTGVLALAGCGASTGSPASAGDVTVQPTKPAVTEPSVTEPATRGPVSTSPSQHGGGPSTPPGSPPATRPAPDGDVDGDGRSDTLSVTDGQRLTARYSGGGSDSVTVRAGHGAGVRVLGAADADSDGHAEVFVQLDQAASQQITTVLRYVAGHLRQVTLNGQPATLPYGGSTGYVTSWSCRPASSPGAALATAAGPSNGPNVYAVTLTYYRFDGERLVSLRSRTATPTALDALPFEHDTVSGQPGCGSVRPGQ